jgi:hypothetical protein
LELGEARVVVLVHGHERGLMLKRLVLVCLSLVKINRE